MNDISILDNRSTVNASHILTVLPPPPTKSHRNSLSSISKQISAAKEHLEASPSHLPHPQPPSVVLNPSIKSNDSQCSSPTEAASSPRSSADKSWSFFQKDGSTSWTNFEEHHLLLGNEEDTSERHSSDEEFDIWSINDESREYYTNQFKAMQPDLNKKILGSTAKEFFEKSKLPTVELSRIWQLSDVDKDGALSIEEFCTAMHLVVLRRNNIELPEVLPPSLVPKIPIKLIQNDTSLANHVQNVPQGHVVKSPKQQSPTELVSPQNKEWTKFNDSPTSSLSSPGMKPVNFDFSAASVEQDPKILHPVALRLSPDKQSSFPSSSESDPSSAALVHSHDSSVDTQVTRTYSSSFSGTSESGRNPPHPPSSMPLGPKKDPPPPPPPRPKYNHTRSSSLDLNRLGKTIPHFLGAPPAVPPRTSPSSATPHKSNVRSEEHLNDPYTHASRFDASNDPYMKYGAFEIYKKPFSSLDGAYALSSVDTEHFHHGRRLSPPLPIDDSTALLVDISQSDEPGGDFKTQGATAAFHPAVPMGATSAPDFNIPKDRKELLARIRSCRERNHVLTMLNHELNQELAEITEERIALEIQLERMKQLS